jgi:serine/threonine protein kinase
VASHSSSAADVDALPCWLSPAEYRLVAKKGEGTFSEVLKAQSIKSGRYVAIKCMKNNFDSLDQVGVLQGG